MRWAGVRAEEVATAADLSTSPHIADVKAVIDLAQTGIWLEYDLFGLENSYYPYNPSFDMPNDGGRMAHVLALVTAGHDGQLLLSHDIAYKSSLVKYGGYGYHHLLVNVVPRLRAKAWTTRAAPARREPDARRRVVDASWPFPVQGTSRVRARRGCCAKAAEAARGQWRLITTSRPAQAFITLRETDLYMIVELPDNAAAASASLIVVASGAGSWRTTVLLSAEDMDRAAKSGAAYRAPGN